MVDQSTLRAQLLQQFAQIYVINLPHRTDRKRQAERQLRIFGLSFADPEVMLFEAVRPDDKGKWPSIGARGCFHSHLNVLKHAAAQGHASILILEDDADWSGSFVRHAPAVLQQIDSLPWRFLHGGTEQSDASPVFRTLAPDNPMMLTHFIAIKGDIIPQIISYLETMASRAPGDPAGGPMHVDGAYSWFRKDHPDVAAYVAMPAVADQRPSRTDIHDLKWFDKVPVLSHTVNILRSYRSRAGS